MDGNQQIKLVKNKIAVDRVSLSLQKGVYGLLGSNGVGKTTLMRMMCGVLKPDSGEIRLGNLSVGEEAYRDKVGYLPQQFGYYPKFTGEDFLMYMAALKGISKRQAKERTAELLATFNLADVAKKKIRTYAGGMKQRLGIAQVLVNRPQILVLDEPTAGLDAKESVKFRNLISRLGSDRIVLLSTYIVSDIKYIADMILAKLLRGIFFSLILTLTVFGLALLEINMVYGPEGWNLPIQTVYEGFALSIPN